MPITFLRKTFRELPGGFKGIKFPKDIVPDRKFEKINTNQLRQLIMKYAYEPLQNRSFMGLTFYSIESHSGEFYEIFASGLTLSREHIARIDLQESPDYAVLFLLFPVSMVRSAKAYGQADKRAIYDLGIKVGEEEMRLVKMRLYYKDVRFITSGKHETKNQGFEVMYEHMDYVCRV